MKKYKIGIVLDNPMRDLNGNSLLAYMLAKSGFEAYLIPMYEQEAHIRRIKPDLVLLNYARTANANKIRAYNRAGIKVGILDTEGGVFRCPDRDFVDVVQKSGVLNLIDYYFLWGPQQQQALRKVVPNGHPKFFVTGTPRYDFVDERWAKCIQKPEIPGGSYVLFLVGFSLINPEFNTPEKEFKTLEKNSVDTPEQISHIFEVLIKAMQGVIGIIKTLARKYPEVPFVVRPHPFENIKAYVDAFADFPNVHVKKEGNVANWIKHSRFVLQFNSSTGIEAGFYDKISILMEMFQDDEVTVPPVVNSSLRANTYEDLFEWVDLLLHEKTDEKLSKNIEVARQNLKTVIADWYYKVDGRSAERIAEAVSGIFEKNPEDEKVAFSALNKRSVYMWSRYFLQKAFDRCFRPEIVETRRLKTFNVDQVQNLIGKFGGTLESIDVEPVTMFKAMPVYKTTAVKVCTHSLRE